MKLTSKGRYALQAILDILTHANGKAVKLEDISDRQKISLHYLEQIFRNLRRAGIVKSVRGPGGGYLIISPETTVGQVLEGAKEQLDYSTGVKPMENPTIEQAHLIGFLKGSEQVVHERLKMKISEMLK